MTIEAYCPEIKFIIESGWFYALLSNKERTDLIAASLTRRIKERGEWDSFWEFAFEKWLESDDSSWGAHGDAALGAWLTDPSTLIRVAGEWVGREDNG